MSSALLSLFLVTAAAQPSAPAPGPAAAAPAPEAALSPEERGRQDRWADHLQRMVHPQPSHPWDATGFLASVVPVAARAPLLLTMDAMIPLLVSIPAAMVGAVAGLAGFALVFSVLGGLGNAQTTTTAPLAAMWLGGLAGG